MGTSEPVRGPPEVSRWTRAATSSQNLDQIALSSNFGALKSAISGSTIGLGGKIMDFLSLPNCAPEVFVHARRDVFVVRMCDVFAYRLRVLEAVTAKCGNATGRGRKCTDATRGFSGRLWEWAFSNPVKRTGTALARIVPRSDDDELLAKPFRQPLPHQACRADHDAHWPRRIGLRPRDARGS